MENVADHRAGGRGDDTDGTRQKGQRLFAIDCEQAFGSKLGLELFEQRHQRAFARQFHPFDHDLIFGAAGIGGEFASGDHLHPILRRKGQPLRPALPHHPVDDRIIILEREIEMA